MPVGFSQGDIIKIEGHSDPLLVISKDFFNTSEQAICCPIVQDTFPGPLHIRIRGSETAGTVLCEHIRYFDLRVRGYTRLDSLDLRSVMDIADAVQSLFDYY